MNEALLQAKPEPERSCETCGMRFAFGVCNECSEYSKWSAKTLLNQNNSNTPPLRACKNCLAEHVADRLDSIEEKVERLEKPKEQPKEERSCETDENLALHNIVCKLLDVLPKDFLHGCRSDYYDEFKKIVAKVVFVGHAKPKEPPAEKPTCKQCEKFDHCDMVKIVEVNNKVMCSGFIPMKEQPSPPETEAVGESCGKNSPRKITMITGNLDDNIIEINISEGNYVMGLISMTPDAFAEWLKKCGDLLPEPDEAPMCEVDYGSFKVRLCNINGKPFGEVGNKALGVESLNTIGKTCTDLAAWIKQKGAGK